MLFQSVAFRSDLLRCNPFHSNPSRPTSSQSDPSNSNPICSIPIPCTSPHSNSLRLRPPQADGLAKSLSAPPLFFCFSLRVVNMFARFFGLVYRANGSSLRPRVAWYVRRNSGNFAPCLPFYFFRLLQMARGSRGNKPPSGDSARTPDSWANTPERAMGQGASSDGLALAHAASSAGGSTTSHPCPRGFVCGTASPLPTRLCLLGAVRRPTSHQQGSLL